MLVSAPECSWMFMERIFQDGGLGLSGSEEAALTTDSQGILVHGGARGWRPRCGPVC